jgi:ferredoxin
VTSPPHPPPPQDTYILDAGLDAGLELPFTCRGGICGACVGRVAEGEVDMSDVSDAPPAPPVDASPA